ncbi:hypothetical protein CFBP5507_24455 (plasmid) [Agrobacterium salinitolerans]|uniref:Uncharacterized protein n=1 Tax=Agrobacterium salinitolerans TaxID=1183413 RepID=A0A9X9KHG3_9HYPH|nr:MULTISPECIES: hypothetical protein [Agrobacterium]UYZ10989.1 hypothetical protein CFBP5507_24455 [Agrobacterium salinitolerans]
MNAIEEFTDANHMAVFSLPSEPPFSATARHHSLIVAPISLD